MLGAFFQPLRVATLLALGICISGCGLADYEKEAEATKIALKELDDIDRLMGEPLLLPEKKGPDGLDQLPPIFMRAPNAGFYGYKKALPSTERDGDGITLYRFSRYSTVTKEEYPRAIYIGFSHVNHEVGFKPSLGSILGKEFKEMKKSTPDFKPRDGMKMEQFDFTKDGEDTTVFMLYRSATDENEKATVAVAFVYQTNSPPNSRLKAEQKTWMTRTMRTIRLDGNADIAKAAWDSRQTQTPPPDSGGGK